MEYLRLLLRESLRRCLIERKIELKNIDAGLAKEPEGAALDLILDELPDAFLGKITRFRDPRHLE